MDAEVAPYPWDDRTQMHADYLYLQQLHERLLHELTVELNQMHGVDHGVRYWRILLGPWLGYFVQMLFDRWTCIQRAIHRYELSGTVVLCGREESFIPNDMMEFPALFVGDEWNHHIYGAILQQFSPVSCSRLPRKLACNTSSKLQSATWRQLVNTGLVDRYSRIAGALSNDRDAFFLSTYLPPLDDLQLQLRLGQVPQRSHSTAAVRIGIDAGKRRWVVGGESRSQFEMCAHSLIPAQMPAVYLEGYGQLVQQAAGQPWPRRPKVIWTSNSHNSDDVFKAWAAGKIEGGAPLVIGQHGGHYGTGRWSFTEDHDVAISDRYLSWGWSDPQHSNVIPVAQLKARRPLKFRHARRRKALLVTCAVPRFSYWMYSASVSRQWLDYFSDQCAFTAALPGPIQDALIVRLYPHDFGWDQASRWRDRFPNLHLDQGESTMDDLIRQSCLYISTYNATTFLESFTMNVPTVIYWNPDQWELRDCAEPYFADLRRVGIFHETPDSAARHVTAIWGDIEAWWQSPAVREVLEKFKHRFCHLPDDALRRVEDAIRGAIAAADKATMQ